MNVVIHSTSFARLHARFCVRARVGQSSLVGLADAINDATLIHGNRAFPYDHIEGDLVGCCLSDHFDAVTLVDGLDADADADATVDLYSDLIRVGGVEMPLDVFVARYSSALPGLPAASCLRCDAFSGWVSDPERVRPTDPEPGYGN